MAIDKNITPPNVGAASRLHAKNEADKKTADQASKDQTLKGLKALLQGSAKPASPQTGQQAASPKSNIRGEGDHKTAPTKEGLKKPAIGAKPSSSKALASTPKAPQQSYEPATRNPAQEFQNFASSARTAPTKTPQANVAAQAPLVASAFVGPKAPAPNAAALPTKEAPLQKPVADATKTPAASAQAAATKAAGQVAATLAPREAPKAQTETKTEKKSDKDKEETQASAKGGRAGHAHKASGGALGSLGTGVSSQGGEEHVTELAAEESLLVFNPASKAEEHSHKAGLEFSRLVLRPRPTLPNIASPEETKLNLGLVALSQRYAALPGEESDGSELEKMLKNIYGGIFA